jgi:hypothetical protein
MTPRLGSLSARPSMKRWQTGNAKNAPSLYLSRKSAVRYIAVRNAGPAFTARRETVALAARRSVFLVVTKSIAVAIATFQL